MKRRSFVAVIGCGILFCFLIPVHKVRSLFLRLRKSSLPNEHELKTATCIAEYIYPEDGSSGAISLGIQNFISVQFNTPYYKKYSSSLKHLILCIDLEAQSMGKNDFLSLSKNLQLEIINNFSSQIVEKKYPGVQMEFNQLIDMTLEGCFSDPMHGGNKKKDAWRMMKDHLKYEWFHV